MDDLVDFPMLEDAMRSLRSEAARGAAEAVIIRRRPLADLCEETGLTPGEVMDELLP